MLMSVYARLLRTFLSSRCFTKSQANDSQRGVFSFSPDIPIDTATLSIAAVGLVYFKKKTFLPTSNAESLFSNCQDCLIYFFCQRNYVFINI